VEAIIPDSEGDAERWVELNRQYASSWPNITRKKPPPPDADEFKDVEGKFDKFFTPEPGGKS
jgi:ferredoxin